MKNVERLVRMLEEAGVRWVFGISSGPSVIETFIDVETYSLTVFD